MRSTNPRDVAYIFRDYSRRIHARALPRDPSFVRLSVACGKIETWCERHYPSFVRLQQVAGGVTYDPNDIRSRVIEAGVKRDNEAAREKRLAEFREKLASGEVARKPAEEASIVTMLLYVAGAFLIVLAITRSRPPIRLRIRLKILILLIRTVVNIVALLIRLPSPSFIFISSNTF